MPGTITQKIWVSNLSDEAFFWNCGWSFISFFMKRFFLSDIWEFLCQARHGFKEHWECSVNDSEWRRLWISSRTWRWIGLWTRRWLKSQTSRRLKWTLILQFWECFVDYSERNSRRMKNETHAPKLPPDNRQNVNTEIWIQIQIQNTN